jgi:hypothetical protein
MRRIGSVLAGMLILLWALPGFAGTGMDRGAPPERGPGSFGPAGQSRARENLDRWRRLSPEEQQRVRENYERWKQLPPEQKQSIRRRLDEFQRLPPEQRQRLREEFRSRPSQPGPPPPPPRP